MIEPANIGIEEGAQIGHAVFQHGDPVDPHSPGKTLILIRIKTTMPQTACMNHAAAEAIHPVIAFTKTTFAGARAITLDGELQARLSKWEEARAEPHVQRSNLEIGFAELCQRPLQVSDI